MRLFVRKVRRQVVDCMRQLMKLAKEKSGDGMFPIVEEMLKKTKLICSIPDTVLVQESIHFLEQNKINKRPEKDEFSESVSEFMQRNKLKIEIETKPSCGSLQTPCTEFICKVKFHYHARPLKISKKYFCMDVLDLEAKTKNQFLF